jgi:hypothetical protein
MTATTHPDNRTTHLLELMTEGDDAFNARDWPTVAAVLQAKQIGLSA